MVRGHATNVDSKILKINVRDANTCNSEIMLMLPLLVLLSYLLDGRCFRDLDGISPVISRLLSPSSIFHTRNGPYSTRISSYIRIHMHKRKCYI